MALPDHVPDAELESLGFVRVSDSEAKHEQFRSWRNKCSHCGDWFKQTLNGKCPKCQQQTTMLRENR